MSLGLVVVAVSRVKRFLRVGVTKSTTSLLGCVCVHPMADRSIPSLNVYRARLKGGPQVV